MSDNWQPGDLAMCVRAERQPERLGRLFTVRQVIMGSWRDEPSIGLRFVDWPDPVFGTRAFDHRFFRKIRPLTAPERDEFLTDLDFDQDVLALRFQYEKGVAR